MRTIVDDWGCHSEKGSVGLEVSGQLLVNGMNVVELITQLQQQIAELTAKLSEQQQRPEPKNALVTISETALPSMNVVAVHDTAEVPKTKKK